MKKTKREEFFDLPVVSGEPTTFPNRPMLFRPILGSDIIMAVDDRGYGWMRTSEGTARYSFDPDAYDEDNSCPTFGNTNSKPRPPS